MNDYEAIDMLLEAPSEIRIAIKEVGKTIRYELVSDKYVTNCAKRYLSSYPDKVYMADGYLFCMIDEEGLPKELPVNFLMEMKMQEFPIQKIVGTAVFIRVKPLTDYDPYDYEITDLTDDDIKLISATLDSDYQEYLKSKFVDYGKGYAVVKKLNLEELLRGFSI